MSVWRLVRRWSLPVVLGLVALASWQAAERADFDSVETEVIAYERSLSTPMLSGRRVPRTLRSPISDELISAEIDEITVGILGKSACVTVRSGDRILGEELDVPGGVIPASNQKLLTTWAALEVLGPDFRFTTRVVASTAPVDGVVDGDLIVIGGGDPFLVTENWLTQYEITDGRHHTRLEDLADLVVAAGITRVEGSIIGDESLLDQVRVGPWDGRLIDQRQSGPLSALSVNEGFVDWPEEFLVSQLRQPTDDPPRHAVSVFAQLLQERGITIGGGTAGGVAPADAVEIVAVQSPPLTDLVAHINTYSSNLGAELVLKYLGLIREGEGSTEAGARVVATLLEEADLPMVDVTVVDGSGLGETNRLTCGLLAALLDRAGPDTVLGRSLAVGGRSGTLALRFVDAPAEGLVLAKTGTLRGVVSLSGYVLSSAPDGDGRYLSFSQILNDDDVVDEELVVEVQEPLVNALVNYPSGPSIQRLSPLEPSPG